MLMDYSSFEITYHVEIAIVMDATGSMRPIIEEVKNNALDFCRQLSERMEIDGKKMGTLRVKVIAFRDFAYNGDRALEESKFFNLPEENEDFHNYVEQIQVFGGGDEPESALEALAVAMRSDWTTEKIPGIKRRHVILVYTDAAAAPLKDTSRPEKSKCSRIENPAYPENMPSNLEELEEMWDGTSQEFKGMPDDRDSRIILFTPNSWPWNNIDRWCYCLPCCCKPNDGLSDVGMEVVVTTVSGCC